MGRALRSTGSILLAKAAFLPFAAEAAEPRGAHRDRNAIAERILLFSGTDISSVSNFAWASADASLLDKRTISGPVLRISGGAGRYEYDNTTLDRRITGHAVSGQFLAGWRHVGPGLTATALAGAEVEHHRLTPDDADNDQAGTLAGLRAAGELWWEPSPRTVVDAHAAFGTAFDSYSARIAAGMRVGGRFLAGPELAALGNRTSGQLRAGLWFSGLRVGRLEMRMAGGALKEDDGGYGAYGNLSAHMGW